MLRSHLRRRSFVRRGSNRRSGGDHIVVMRHGRVPAARLLRRQRRLPLPRPRVRRAALRAGGRARRRVAADRRRRRPSSRSGAGPWRAYARLSATARRTLHRLGRRARRDERLLLPRDRPAAARHGRGDRVPPGDRAGRARSAHGAERRALALAVAGVYLLTDVRLEGEPLGVALALANAVLFALYIVLGHRVAQAGATSGIDGLAASMLVALVVVTPLGVWDALPAFTDPVALAAGVGVGDRVVRDPVRAATSARWRASRGRRTRCSSRSCRRRATAIGVVVLGQVPTARRGRRVAARRSSRSPRTESARTSPSCQNGPSAPARRGSPATAAAAARPPARARARRRALRARRLSVAAEGGVDRAPNTQVELVHEASIRHLGGRHEPRTAHDPARPRQSYCSASPCFATARPRFDMHVLGLARLRPPFLVEELGLRGPHVRRPTGQHRQT